MANPQLEDGFIRIANRLYEAYYTSDMNEIQLKITSMLIRYTYGFNRKSFKLSAGFVSKVLNVSKQYAARQIKILIEKNIFKVVSAELYKPYELKLNKNFEEWKTEKTIKENINNLSQECKPQVYSKLQVDSKPQVDSSVNHKFTVVSTTGLPYKDNIKTNIKTITTNSKKFCDENIKKAIQLYEQNIGVPSPIVRDVLRDILNSHSTDLLELAIQERYIKLKKKKYRLMSSLILIMQLLVLTQLKKNTMRFLTV